MPTLPPSDARKSVLSLRAAFDDAWRLVDRPDAHNGILALFFDLAAWRPWLEEAACLLDAAEQARVQRRQRPRDREELALSYALHRLVLGAVLQRDAAQVALGRDALGRPCLPGDELHTSLSHADGFAAVAVTALERVGIDLELATRAPEMAEIAGRVCHPAEARALAGLPNAERMARLLALWVRKEALLKAAGIGLAHEMDTFEAPAGVVLPLPGDGGGDTVIRMLDIGPAWVAAVAGVPGADVRVAWLRPHA